MPRRQTTSSVLSPNLTPLLDMVLQLITFFMMLVHFGSRLEGANRAIRLPLAPASLPGSELALDRMSVGIDAQGRLLDADQRPLDEKAAAQWWDGEAKARRRGLETLKHTAAGEDSLPTLVILRADRDASYGAVRRALAQAQDRGFAHFSLVVLRSRQP